MSTPVVWLDSPLAEVAEAGARMPDGQRTDTDALVLGGDTVVVIEGDLERFAAAVAAAVTGPAPSYTAAQVDAAARALHAEDGGSPQEYAGSRGMADTYRRMARIALAAAAAADQETTR